MMYPTSRIKDIKYNRKGHSKNITFLSEMLISMFM